MPRSPAHAPLPWLPRLAFMGLGMALALTFGALFP